VPLRLECEAVVMARCSTIASLRTNRLLAALDAEDLLWLAPSLEFVELQQGAVIANQGGTIRHTYFPHDAIISLTKQMRDGRQAEMAVFGREAVVGIAFLGIPIHSLGNYIVQLSGTASRISAKRMHEAVTARPKIQRLFHCYTEALMVQTLQSVACNAAHSVEARCCRRILRTHDRVGRDELPLTHEFLALMLGVQRSTVSTVTRTLQDAGFIRQGRGTITVVNRAGLEEAACECYSIIRQRYEQLIPCA